MPCHCPSHHRLNGFRILLILVAMTTSLLRHDHAIMFVDAFKMVNTSSRKGLQQVLHNNGNRLLVGNFGSRSEQQQQQQQFVSSSSSKLSLAATPPPPEDNNKHNNNNNNNDIDDTLVAGGIADFFMKRWDKADFLEIRLDATLASCHVLAQYLVFDMNLPKKDIPGFEVEDVILLANLFSSVVVLAILWTAAGLVTGIFLEGENKDVGVTTASGGGSLFDPVRLIGTTVLAGPSWLAICIAFHWAPAGILADPSMNGIVAAVVFGCLGLCATMSLGRIVSSNLLFR